MHSPSNKKDLRFHVAVSLVGAVFLTIILWTNYALISDWTPVVLTVVIWFFVVRSIRTERDVARAASESGQPYFQASALHGLALSIPKDRLHEMIAELEEANRDLRAKLEEREEGRVGHRSKPGG